MDTILHSDNQARNAAAASGGRKKRTAGKVLWEGMIFSLLIWLLAETGTALGIPVTQPFESVAECIRTNIPQETAEQVQETLSDFIFDWVADSLSVCGYFSRVSGMETNAAAKGQTASVCATAFIDGAAEIPLLKYAADAFADAADVIITGNEPETDGGKSGNEAEEGNGIGENGPGDGSGDGTETEEENGSDESGSGDGSGDKNETKGGGNESGLDDETGDGAKTGEENGSDENGFGDESGGESGTDGGNSETAQTGSAAFLMPAVTGTLYLADTLTYSFLTSEFYNISSSTVVYESELNGSLLSVPLALSEITEEPQILIYHTHSHEFFADSDTSDLSTGIVGVGDYLTELLEGYGYSVLHLTDQFDYVDGVLDRSRAYTYAAARLKEVLAEYPSIEVMIDLHRDGVDDSMHLVTEINGKTTAMIMFFNGMSRTASGNISYLPNSNLTENLAFSLQLKVKAEAYYPGFTRKNYIKPYRYNLHLLEKALLIEAGAQTNTLQEVLNAMEPLAVLLHIQLAGLE